jgi:hypothetical protein
MNEEQSRTANNFNIIIKNNYKDYNCSPNSDFLNRKKYSSVPFEALRNERDMNSAFKFDENDYINTFNYSFNRFVKPDFEDDISLLNKDIFTDLFTYSGDVNLILIPGFKT